jgi:hypothetical protein
MNRLPILALLTPAVMLASHGNGVAGRRSSFAADSCIRYDARLKIDKRTSVYVEPTVVEASHGDVLLAGLPNFLWTRVDREDSISLKQDSLFGVVLRRAGDVHVVNPPVSMGRAIAPRAIAREVGGWSVVFAEAATFGRIQDDPQVERLWSAELNGLSWRHLEPIPLPREGNVLPRRATRLLRAADTLTFAVPVRYRNGTEDAVVYQRINGQWRYEVVALSQVAYMALAHTRAHGFVLGIVKPDLALPEDENSLFLYSHPGAWREFSKVVSGKRTPVHAPVLVAHADTIAVGWLTPVGNSKAQRWQAMATTIVEGHLLAPVVVDSNSASIAEATLGSAGIRWISDHISPGGRHSILITPYSHGALGVSRSLDSPFEGPFSVSRLSTSTTLVSGPERIQENGVETVVTRLLSLGPGCNTGR